MIRILLYTVIIGLIICPLASAETIKTAHVKIYKIKTRASGTHLVFFQDLAGNAYTIPEETPAVNCTYRITAVIDESEPGGKTLYSAAVTAYSAGQKLFVNVTGCAQINPGQSTSTAPKILDINSFYDLPGADADSFDVD